MDLGAPSQHPTTQPRSDSFSIDGFWQNVEKLPGGIAAENWFLSQQGQVYWGWTLSITHGRWEPGSDGKSIPVVHIPWQNNEVAAAEAFVINIAQSWATGFADYSQLAKVTDPISMQTYIENRFKAQANVAAVGAEVLLSALTLVNEGADWAVTINDISKAKTPGQAAIASIGLLPFITNSSLKILSVSGDILLEVSSKQRLLMKNFLDAYATLGYGTYKTFNVVERIARDGSKVIVLQRGIDWNKRNLIRMSGITDAGLPRFHNAPVVFNYNLGKNGKVIGEEVVNLHHIDQLPEGGGALAEILTSENKAINLLHPGANGVDNSTIIWSQWRSDYWKSRLQDALDAGQVPQDVLKDENLRKRLTDGGFKLPN